MKDKNYQHQFENHLKDYLLKNNLHAPVVVNYSEFESYQYQTPLAFVLKKQNPQFIPEKLIEYLKQYENVYEQVSLTGQGFISVKFKLKPQADILYKPQHVVVDYCGVNVAKQMHIGHIRSMFIGDFVARLHLLKDKVTIVNHIGDWGNQFGFLLNYIIQNGLEKSLNNKTLTQYYKEAFALTQTDDEFAQNSAVVAQKLQMGKDKDIYELWSKLVNISLSEAAKTFDELNLKMTLNHTQGESFYAPFCQNLLNKLIDKKIATHNEDGSVVVFFDKKSPLVLQKSNGNFLYALYDLAALEWRQNNLNPDKIVYVVDKRQALHFEQVFEVAYLANLVKPTTKLVHLGFGTVLGADKKPLKTKSGQSLYLDDLLNQGKEILLENEHFIEMSELYKNDILNKTIIGGMKFYDLKFNKHQDYVFNWEHVLNFTGGSAPYIQNALVRIDSIMFKLFSNTSIEKTELDFFCAWSEEEKNIIFNLQKTHELIENLDNTYASQTMTTHAIKICQLFHKYYEQNKIIGAVDEDKKVMLISEITDNLKKLCDILGIETYPCQQRLEYTKKNKLSV